MKPLIKVHRFKLNPKYPHNRTESLHPHRSKRVMRRVDQRKETREKA